MTDKLQHDDLLLDAIGGGTADPCDEPIVVLLSAWQRDITTAAIRCRVPDLPLPPEPPARPRHRPVRAATAAAMTVAMTGVLGVATLHATPDSPLWPVTTTVFPERANLFLAQQSIRDARQAAAEGRYTDSYRHLDRAMALIDQLGAHPQGPQLRAEVNAIKLTLPATFQPAAPAPAPAPATPRPANPHGDKHHNGVRRVDSGRHGPPHPRPVTVAQQKPPPRPEPATSQRPASRQHRLVIDRRTCHAHIWSATNRSH